MVRFLTNTYVENSIKKKEFTIYVTHIQSDSHTHIIGTLLEHTKMTSMGHLLYREQYPFFWPTFFRNFFNYRSLFSFGQLLL
jgi:hypothetical protein